MSDMAFRHGHVQSALRGEADRLGVRLTIESVPGERDNIRRYAMVLERWGRRNITMGNVYALPVEPEKLMAHMRESVRSAALASEKNK